MSSWFVDVNMAPAVEVFALTAAFNEDGHTEKVNMGVGAYRSDESKPWVLPVVRSVETQISADLTLNHEYLPIAGLPEYRLSACRLLLGENSRAVVDNKVDSIQAIGGTGAVRLGMDLLRNKLGFENMYLSRPTWGNHHGIAKSLHYPSVKEYRYWDNDKKCIDIDGMLEDLRNAPERSVVLLHMCAHNPTGMDPTLDQWKQIAAVVREKRLFPFFDCAYQGFASGDLDKDAASVRMFVDEGFELLAAQSFSKNFGLYNERVGNLLFIVNEAEHLPKVRSQLVTIVRETWSNPPSHGARIVATILNNPQLYNEWKETVKGMAQRIQTMRQLLFQKLKALGTPGTWDHLVQQSGLFAFTGLTAHQAEFLIKEYHIYLMRDGRINVCAITTKNADYIANAIHDAVTKVPSKC
jgi:aspartate aminotransferase